MQCTHTGPEKTPREEKEIKRFVIKSFEIFNLLTINSGRAEEHVPCPFSSWVRHEDGYWEPTGRDSTRGIIHIYMHQIIFATNPNLPKTRFNSNETIFSRNILEVFSINNNWKITLNRYIRINPNTSIIGKTVGQLTNKIFAIFGLITDRLNTVYRQLRGRMQ